MHPWTLVFDLDGTLVDTAPDLAAATNHVMATLGLTPVSVAEIRPFVGHGALAMMSAAAATHGRLLQESELHEMFEIFLEHYSAHIADVSRPYPGAIETLQRLRGAGATLAVCTNKLEHHARQLLTALDMTDLFAAITGRDSLGVYKPDPGHFTGTVERARGLQTHAIMIGDSETDIQTAKAARVPVVAVDFGYSQAPVSTLGPDAIISSYRGLEPALLALM